jgi:basic amino acid/polyamine antiporter, APA family
MTETVGQPAPEVRSQGVYARRATGLVREVSPFSTFVFNMAGQPTPIFLAVSIFFVLGLFPGGSIWLGFAMAFAVALILCVCYGLFTSAIPRSGGDYVLVGRVIHPVIGLISSFFWMAGVVLSIAFIAQAFVTVALAPSLTAVGLVSGHHTLVTAGDTLATSQAWQFGIGTGVILTSALLLAGGWRWTTRIMNSLWVLSMIGLATVFLVLLFKSHRGFVNNFNEFAAPITGKPDSYNNLIATAHSQQIDTTPAFSLHNTWPVWAAISSLSLYSWLSIYISGEVRRARDTTQMKIMGLATAVHIGIAVILAVVFFWKFGHDFFVAINALNGSEKYPFASPPYYTFLTSITGGSTALAWFLFLTFAVAYPLLILPNIIIGTRTFFAWALDGVLPTRVSRVSQKTHAPNWGIALVVVISIAVLYWAVTAASSFFGVLVEAVLLQLVTMILVGIAAVLLPYRRPEVWRASATTKKIGGIPVVALAGGLVAVLLAGLFFVYLHYADLGIKNGRFFRDCAIVLGASLITFFVARAARARQGVDVDKLAMEIPPE